ncbi:MAG: four helix bundle protein [Lentisphaerae bacterium]|jgi:four helix bundle protein|nr:four helix bundle protein [Lentisphaerota bacterium]
MAKLFGHEKLHVYGKAMQFAARRNDILGGLHRRVAACDHFNRSSESILVNIAHSSNTWSPKERIVYLGHASGSVLESAACLDVFVAKQLLTKQVVYADKSLLSEIARMLFAMRKATADRVREDLAMYPGERLFRHEDLDVYQTALRLTGWLEDVTTVLSCSADLLAKLDTITTSIVLNIAEGNGRFSVTDQAKFLGIAYKATVQSAALVDLATVQSNALPSQIEEGRNMLRSIAAMITSLSRAVTRT